MSPRSCGGQQANCDNVARLFTLLSMSSCFSKLKCLAMLRSANRAFSSLTILYSVSQRPALHLHHVTSTEITHTRLIDPIDPVAHTLIPLRKFLFRLILLNFKFAVLSTFRFFYLWLSVKITLVSFRCS